MINIDEKHYIDDSVDVRYIPEFNLVVFTSTDGIVESVSYDTNFFSPADLVSSYRSVFPEDGDDKEEHVRKYKEYLVACGCSEDELDR